MAQASFRLAHHFRDLPSKKALFEARTRSTVLIAGAGFVGRDPADGQGTRPGPEGLDFYRNRLPLSHI